MGGALLFALVCLGIGAYIFHQNQELKEKDWKMMANQSKMIAEKTLVEIQKGNVYSSVLALLEIIPNHNERPFVPEMECALRAAYDSLQNMKWTYRLLEIQASESFMSDNEKYIVVSKDRHIDVYDFNTLNICTYVELPSEIDALRFRTYLSKDETLLYVAYSSGVLIYSIPEGQLVENIKSDEIEKGKKYVRDLYRPGKDCNGGDIFDDIVWKCVNEWATSLFGLRPDDEVLDYCDANNLALVRRDFSNIFLYDCMSKQEVKTNFFPSPPFEVIGDYSDCSFSKDGNQLILSHTINGSLLYDIKNATTRYFKEKDCLHYSNWIRFSNNGQYLHSSRTISRLDIIDAISLEIVDSIVPQYESYIWDAYTNENGDKCLVLIDEEVYMYYKHFPNNYKNIIDRSSFTKLEKPVCVSDTIINGRFHLTVNDEGIRCEDIVGEYKSWSHTFLHGSDILGYAHNNRYLLVSDHNLRSSNFCVIDLASGTTIFKEDEDQYWLYIYYNYNTNQILFENPNYDKTFVYDFLPLKSIISRLQELTKGMSLSSRERMQFFLE